MWLAWYLCGENKCILRSSLTRLNCHHIPRFGYFSLVSIFTGTPISACSSTTTFCISKPQNNFCIFGPFACWQVSTSLLTLDLMIMKGYGSLCLNYGLPISLKHILSKTTGSKFLRLLNVMQMRNSCCHCQWQQRQYQQIKLLELSGYVWDACRWTMNKEDTV